MNSTWQKLNSALGKVKSHEAALAMLKAELKGARRQSYAMRIFGRYATLRTEYDRKRMLAGEWPK